MTQACRFLVRVTPRGGADRVDGVGEDGELRIRVRAAAAGGAANEATIRLLADVLGAARSAVRIERGARMRLKRISVTGLSSAQMRAVWPALAVTES